MENQKAITITTSELEMLIRSIIEPVSSKIYDSASGDVSEVLTVPQAAEFLHLSQSTIYTYISKRIIPFTKRNGSVWLLRSKLMKWLEEGEKPTIHQLAK